MRRTGISFSSLYLLAVVSNFFIASAYADSKDSVTSSIGNPIADFSLKDSAGKAWSLADFKNKKAIVVLFLGTECPINNASMPKLLVIDREYSPKGVQFLAINANHLDTHERVAAHAKKNDLSFPVLKDPDQTIADRFGASRTPEAFVLDAERRIRYQGRIDDQFGIGFARPKPTRRDLALALDEVLAGKPVSQAITPVAGCLIARKVIPKAEGQVTYTKNVSRILQNKCQECHRPGQIGPMPLLTYEDASSWSATIREVLEQNRMPPWHADPRFGKFENNRGLAAEDRAALLAWIDQDCPKGDAADLPPPREFADGWRIGKPDAVFTMKEEFKVPAKAPARGVPYQYFIIPTNFPEDRWVQAAEAKAGNR